MPPRSAPSAKRATLRSSTVLDNGGLQGFEDTLSRLSEGRNAFPGRALLSLALGVVVVDLDRAYAGTLTRFDVAPAVADHEALRQVDAVTFRRVENQAGRRLAAVAVVGVVVEARFDAVQRQGGHQVVVERIDGLTGSGAAHDVRLVRHDDQAKAGAPQLVQRIFDAGEDVKLCNRAWRLAGPAVGDGFVDHAVAVEEHCTALNAGV